MGGGEGETSIRDTRVRTGGDAGREGGSGITEGEGEGVSHTDRRLGIGEKGPGVADVDARGTSRKRREGHASVCLCRRRRETLREAMRP